MSITTFRPPQEALAGQAAAAAGEGLAALGAHLEEHGARDANLLGLSRLPGPGPYTVAIDTGTWDERKARIDAWAKAHGVTAGWDTAAAGLPPRYLARVKFGPVTYAACTWAEGTLQDWHEAARERMNELLDGVRQGRRPAA